MNLSICPPLYAAALGAAGLSALFVGGLYVGVSKRVDRDEPRVVVERFGRVGLVCCAAPLLTWVAASAPGGRAASLCVAAPLWRWLGLWSPVPFRAAAVPLGLTMLLFLGPLAALGLDAAAQGPAALRERLAQRVRGRRQRLLLCRNLLVGPFAEEWVFRACTCPLLFGAGLGDAANVWGSAVCFGAAHLHHVFDGGGDVKAVAVMFVYTSLFGAYSSYLFLRTGTVAGPLAAHIFCNAMGLPDFAGVPRHPRRRLVAGCYVAGLAGFIAAVSLDAASRPPLFGSLFWAEAGAMGVAHGALSSS